MTIPGPLVRTRLRQGRSGDTLTPHWLPLAARSSTLGPPIDRGADLITALGGTAAMLDSVLIGAGTRRRRLAPRIGSGRAADPVVLGRARPCEDPSTGC